MLLTEAHDQPGRDITARWRGEVGVVLSKTWNCSGGFVEVNRCVPTATSLLTETHDQPGQVVHRSTRVAKAGRCCQQARRGRTSPEQDAKLLRRARRDSTVRQLLQRVPVHVAPSSCLHRHSISGSAIVARDTKSSVCCACSICAAPMPSACDVAKRHLVHLLRTLGKKYGVSVMTSQDAVPQDVNRCYRSVARKAHPDKPGGCTRDFQELSNAHDAWTDLQKAERPVGTAPKAQCV